MGVMQRQNRLPNVRQRLHELLNDHIVSKALSEQIDGYRLPSGLGNQFGSLGTIAMQIEKTDYHSAI